MIDQIDTMLRHVSEKYITGEIAPEQYVSKVAQSLLNILQPDVDVGFYDKPNEVGWVGWITIGDCTIHFAPADVLKLCGDERSRLDG